METISYSDRERLRSLARQKREMAESPRNEAILKQWEAEAHGRRETPTVRLLFSNFVPEVVDCRMTCEGPTARRLESQLLSSMVGRELFDDDTPLSPTFEVSLNIWADPFGLKPQSHRNNGSRGFHIDPVVDDIEADFEKSLEESL